MPWDKDGKNNGPWGKGSFTPPPKKPENQNELDELIQKSRERFKDVFQQGGNYTPFGILLIIGIILFGWLASGFYIVDAKEEAVVMRFGKFHRSATPGLHYRFPFPVEKIIKIPVTTVNSVQVGLRTVGNTYREVPQESLMLTGDENIVDISFEVQWRIDDVKNFVFKVRDPESTVKSVAESAMREVIGRTPIASALAEGKSVIQSEAQKLLQDTLDNYEAGIEIVALQLRKVDPPGAVIDSFRDVQTARADMERARNEAETYRNDILPRARGDAERILQDAEAYKNEVVARAQGESQRFLSVYDKYKDAKDVTKKRIYLETMEQVLSGMNKIVVDTSSKSGVVPYLPLNDIKRAPKAAAQPAPQPAAQ
ncbi:MAG: FtsH protease activity modulator HflK [Proteobacteria bacterium]|nr:FtsH protease activity modulator HflK [Pseudomonadota bacterium]